MDITRFDDLLQAARQQPDPQRLLLVFAGASLPEQASDAQRAEVAAGTGGELAPLMCVDKDPQLLAGFDMLVEESHGFEQPWALVFAAALSGRAGQAPGETQVESALQAMVEAVRSGRLDGLIPFDRSGNAVRLR